MVKRALLDSTGRYEKIIWNTEEWFNRVNEEISLAVEAGVYKSGFRWVELPEAPSWYDKRHVCSIRSICETLGINPGQYHCVCGKTYNDPVHLTSSEIALMSNDDKLYL